MWIKNLENDIVVNNYYVNSCLNENLWAKYDTLKTEINTILKSFDWRFI